MNISIDTIFEKLAQVTVVPFQDTIIVLPFDSSLAIHQLRKVTIKPSEHPINRYQEVPGKYFCGTIKENSFHFTKIIKSSNFFIPEVKGIIEKSKNGCIVIVDFKMLKSPIILLMFWTILCFLMAVFFFFVQKLPLYAFFSLFFVFFNYIVSILNFNKEVAHTKELLNTIFNQISLYDN